MIRYCQNCKQSFDFTIKSAADLEHLICPNCGKPVDKNSKPPANVQENEAPARFAGRLYSYFIYFNFIFYPLCGAVGIAAYFLHWYTVLYVATLVGVCVMLLRYGIRSNRILWPVIGAAAGFFYLHTLEGACLGAMTAFILRFLYINVLMRLFAKLVRIGR